MREKSPESLMTFAEILERRDVRLSKSRLLRHNSRGTSEWRRGKAAFGHFASYQGAKSSPYNECRFAFHFIPDRKLDDRRNTALFVGATEVLCVWEHDGRRQPRMSTAKAVSDTPYKAPIGVRAFDLKWMEGFEDLEERLVIAWTGRQWTQWANGSPKEVVEFRRERREPPFPDFLDLRLDVKQVPLLWESWRGALSSVRGVYLLVDPDGNQYVGSAYGEGGFLTRWHEYAANGHGGNHMLMEKQSHDYTVSILEVAGSAMSTEEIIDRESVWKGKLGSRAHGLNAN